MTSYHQNLLTSTIFLITYCFNIYCIDIPCIFPTSQEDLDNLSSQNCNYLNVSFSALSYTNLEGLRNIERVEGDLSFFLTSPNLTSLHGLENLVNITGELLIRSTHLEKLNGLTSLKKIGGNLVIRDNDKIKAIDALSNLKSVGGGIFVYSNALQTNIYGISNINNFSGSLFLSPLSSLECSDSCNLKIQYNLESMASSSNPTSCSTNSSILLKCIIRSSLFFGFSN